MQPVDRWTEDFGRASPDFAAKTRVRREFAAPEDIYRQGFDFIRSNWAASP